jgi:hypothetical protein
VIASLPPQGIGRFLLPYSASSHNMEEMEKAREIPCPVHGKLRFKNGTAYLPIDMPLAV